MTKNIAIFASGGGSNARKIHEYFLDRSDVSIKLIVSNNKESGVLKFANDQNIPTLLINNSNLKEPSELIARLKSDRIDLIVLAGFLKLIPIDLILAFPNGIINIHPALLPKYGGKGMYGMNVHKAVFENKEKESGITIHYVNQHYDEGAYIFQKSCSLLECSSPEMVAKTVLATEHQHFAPIIDNLLTSAFIPLD